LGKRRREEFYGVASVTPPVTSFSNLVAASGGDFTTLQSAVDDEGSMFYVEGNQTYAVGATFDNNCQSAVFMAGTTVTGAITVSGENVSLIFMPGCTLSATIIWNGAGGRFIAENGLNYVGIDCNASDLYVDLGGLDSEGSGEIDIDGSECMINNLSLNTLGTGGRSINIGETSTAVRNFLNGIDFIDSDSSATRLWPTNSDECMSFLHCISDCNNNGIDMDSQLGVCAWVNMIVVGTNGVNMTDDGDDCIAYGNTVQDHSNTIAGNAIPVTVNHNDGLVYANRVDDLGTGDGIDNLGGATVAANNEAAIT